MFFQSADYADFRRFSSAKIRVIRGRGTTELNAVRYCPCLRHLPAGQSLRLSYGLCGWMEKETILDRRDGRGRWVCMRGSGRLGSGAMYHGEPKQRPDIRLHPPGAPIPSRPHCVAPVPPVKDAAATRWFPFPPTPNGTEPSLRFKRYYGSESELLALSQAGE